MDLRPHRNRRLPKRYTSDGIGASDQPPTDALLNNIGQSHNTSSKGPPRGVFSSLERGLPSPRTDTSHSQRLLDLPTTFPGRHGPAKRSKMNNFYMNPEWARYHSRSVRTDSRTLAPAAFPSLPLYYVPAAAFDADAARETVHAEELEDLDLAPLQSAEDERPDVLTSIQTLAIQSYTGHYNPSGTPDEDAIRAEQQRMIQERILPRPKTQRKRRREPEEEVTQPQRPRTLYQSVPQASFAHTPPNVAEPSKASERIRNHVAVTNAHQEAHVAKARRRFMKNLPKPKQPAAEPSPLHHSRSGNATLSPDARELVRRQKHSVAGPLQSRHGHAADGMLPLPRPMTSVVVPSSSRRNSIVEPRSLLTNYPQHITRHESPAVRFPSPPSVQYLEDTPVLTNNDRPTDSVETPGSASTPVDLQSTPPSFTDVDVLPSQFIDLGNLDPVFGEW